ncbi:ABC transporter substrate-binding protein [Bacillus sp. 03113]|uniref:ABC transporter substrate-binding protein n=1 Tax=Bacillus sp. 03113 TaxID=2578211 RepID=UPI0011423878|nr:ABC transporter substrate-binding protein [Bacillus sp. 03113]
MNSLKRAVSLIAILSLFLLAACSGGSKSTTSEDSGSKKGGTVFIGLVNAPVSFNTINSSDIAAQFLEKFMFETFLDMDKPLSFTPRLAESFDTTDNQTFTIKLQKDAKWSDGTPVTAKDIAFTMNLVANPKTETSVGAYITVLDGLTPNGKLPEGVAEIPSIKVIDDKTFEFKTKKPVDPNMIKEQLGTKFMILPEHVLKNVAPENLQKDPFMQNPTVTNGPFKFVQYKKDQYVEYARNDQYYLGKPILDKVYVKIMPAPNLVAQLQTGEIHMNAAGGIGKIVVQDYKTVEGYKDVTTKTEPNIGYQTIMFNNQTVKDPKVRQAIAYAINRKAILDKLLLGKGEIVDGPYTSVSPYLDKEMDSFTYDPEKAKQMLQDAGFDFNKPIRFVVPLGNKVREQSADIIAENLKAIGLKLETATFDFPTIMSKARAGDYDLLLIGLSNTIDPDVSYLYSKDGSSNYMKYNNPKVDELLAAGKSEADSKKRKEIYADLQRIWNEDMPVFTLYSDYDFAAVSKEVKFGGPKVFGFHKDLQKWSLVGAE